jgi:hypothetical protein
VSPRGAAPVRLLQHRWSCRFTSTFSGLSSATGAYSGTWEWDLDNERDRQDTVAGADKQIWIDLYNDAGGPTSYFFCAWIPLCDTEILVPPMMPFAVPSDSTFQGYVTKNGVANTQHWQYVFNGDHLHLVTDYYVAQQPQNGNAWFPVAIEYSGTSQPTVHVNWTSVAVGPPPASQFSIPSSWNCQPDIGASRLSRTVSDRVKAALAVERVPQEGMARVARMLGSAALRAGLPRTDQTCPPSSSSMP